MKKKPYVARDPRQLLVIASPGRDEIIDAVSAIGPCTITELAHFLGRSRNGLYYHVRALRDCGIFLESHRTGGGQQRTARYDLPGRPISVYFDLATEKSRKAVVRLASSRMRSGVRGFKKAFRPGLAVVEGPRRNMWASRWTGWLSEAELERANRCFAQLTGLFRKTAGRSGAGRKYYELTFVLAPTFPQPPANLAHHAGVAPSKRSKKARR